MWTSTRLLCAAALSLAAGATGAQDRPGQIVIRPEQPVPLDPFGTPPSPLPPGPPVAEEALPPQVEAQPLGTTDPDAVGILPGAVTGFPSDLWSGSRTGDLAAQFRALLRVSLPALQSFTRQLALAEARAPQGGQEGAFLAARVDLLTGRGALAPALALIESAGPDTPILFPRWFDLTLLSGDPGPACAALSAQPNLSPDPAARIFCLARSGDWSAAALTLQMGATLGTIESGEADLLARFLDPELFEGMPLAPPRDPDALDFVMLSALGERPATGPLPLAFAHADLDGTAGWQAQLEAAERLVRAGAIEPGEWQAIFTARRPAASGQPWDRVAALQALDTALADADRAAAARALPFAWNAAREARLEAPFSALYAQPLRALDLPVTVADIVQDVALLSDQYEIAARDGDPAGRMEAFLFAIAQGRIAPAPPGDPLAAAVEAAFRDPSIPLRYQEMAQTGRLGEALLWATRPIASGDPDPGDLEEALRLYAGVGLIDLARRTAIQTLLLERR